MCRGGVLVTFDKGFDPWGFPAETSICGFNRMSTFAKSHESLHPIDLCAARSHLSRPCSVCRVYRVSQWAGPLSLNKSAKSAPSAVHITEGCDAA